MRAKESARELGREDRRCDGGRGSSVVYIGVLGGPGRWQRVVTSGG
jgi:hypothetical protein